MPPRPKSAPPPEPPSDEPQDAAGYFRNTGLNPITVLAQPVTVLPPGRIARFDRIPTHRDLAPATEADFAAQQAADESATAAKPDDADPAAAESTDKEV